MKFLNVLQHFALSSVLIVETPTIVCAIYLFKTDLYIVRLFFSDFSPAEKREKRLKYIMYLLPSYHSLSPTLSSFSGLEQKKKTRVKP